MCFIFCHYNPSVCQSINTQCFFLVHFILLLSLPVSSSVYILQVEHMRTTWLNLTPFVFLCVKQTKLYELEGQVRRGAAERGVAEMKKNEFQEEIQRQKEQISHIENLYKRQLEGAQNTCSQEKVKTNTTNTKGTICSLNCCLKYSHRGIWGQWKHFFSLLWFTLNIIKGIIYIIEYW